MGYGLMQLVVGVSVLGLKSFGSSMVLLVLGFFCCIFMFASFIVRKGMAR